MRSKYLSICFGALILAAAAATADDPEAQKRGQPQPAAPDYPSDAPLVDLEAQKLGQSLPAPPAYPSDAPTVDFEELKRGLPPPASPAYPADAPSVDLEELKRIGHGSVAEPSSRSLEDETKGVSQAAIQAIPLRRGTGPRILPFPDADGRPMPIGRSLIQLFPDGLGVLLEVTRPER